jgi:hypothetical protein
MAAGTAASTAQMVAAEDAGAPHVADGAAASRHTDRCKGGSTAPPTSSHSPGGCFSRGDCGGMSLAPARTETATVPEEPCAEDAPAASGATAGAAVSTASSLATRQPSPLLPCVPLTSESTPAESAVAAEAAAAAKTAYVASAGWAASGVIAVIDMYQGYVHDESGVWSEVQRGVRLNSASHQSHQISTFPRSVVSER